VADFCEHGNESFGFKKRADYSLKSSVTNNFSNDVLHHRVSYVAILVI
jgi:hypothetical protein